MSVPFNKLFNVRSCIKLIQTRRSLREGTIKVGIVGSRTYENKDKIKEMIFMLKQKLGNVEIVSGGATHGADKYAKKFALELGLEYSEFNPAYTSKNLYSVMPIEYYDQPYHISQLMHRNELIVMYADQVIIFRSAGESNGSDHVLKMCKKHNKPFVIIGDKI